MRGLKLEEYDKRGHHVMSHLLQMRGLKQIFGCTSPLSVPSHLLQMRGLKPESVFEKEYQIGRIFYRCVD